MIYDPKLSHFDLDVERGKQAELFVSDIRSALAGTGRLEVKRDAWWPQTRRLYVERECCGRDGNWRPSGIAVTKADLWIFVAPHHIAMVIETAWLKRAVDFSEKRHPKNGLARCEYGKNPTKGIYIYEHDIFETRDKTLDEH